MTRRTKNYYSFNTGELDPRLQTRADVKHYFSALKTGKNLIGLPQGGVRFKSGSWHKSVLRRKMVSVSFSGATLAAPNGGTAANVIDVNFSTALTTNSITNGTTFVALTVDFGSAKELAAFDLVTVRCATSKADAVLQVQSSPDNSNWTDYGTRMPLSTTARNFRFALAPGLTRSARCWRVVVINAPSGLGALSITEIFCRSTGDLSAARAIEVNVDPDNIYVIVLTELNADVFENGVWRAAILTNHSNTDLAEISWTASLDSVFLFHKNSPPWRLLRMGSATIWSGSVIDFVNIPRFDFGDTIYTNGVDEKQIVHISSGVGRFTLTVAGYETASINLSPTPATTATRIKDALELLSNVDAGLTVAVDYTDGDSYGISVIFTGGTNTAKPWEQMIPRLTGGTSTIVVARDRHGQEGGEDLWSATRGYPRHGVIFQQRLVMAGFRSRGNAMAWSRTGELFDFDLNFVGPTAAILDLLDSDDDRTIRRLHIGRNLQIFTNTSAHYISNRTIDATQPRDIAQAARTGIVAGSRSVDLQGATIFVEEGGEVVREFLYNDVEQSYDSGNLSILQSHLITTASDIAVKRSSSSTDADLIFVVREDGALPVMVAERAESVTGVTWLSNANGPYRAICVEGNGLVHAVRERSIDGVTELVLEVFDDDIVLDAAIQGSIASRIISGLDALEGLEVWAYADGSPYGPFTVTDGEIDLSTDLDDTPLSVIVGLWDAPFGETLPLREADSEGAPIRRRRIHKVHASIFETGNIAIGANGQPPQEIPIFDFGNVMEPLLDRLVTGEVKRQGILGWSLDATITFTQTVPAPFMLRGLRAEYDG